MLVGGRKKRFVFAGIAEMFACPGIFQEMPQSCCWSEWFGNHRKKVLSMHFRQGVNLKENCYKWVDQSYSVPGKTFSSQQVISLYLFTIISCRIWSQITSDQSPAQDKNMISPPGTSVQGLHVLALSDQMLQTFPPWIHQCQESEPHAHLWGKTAAFINHGKKLK